MHTTLANPGNTITYTVGGTTITLQWVRTGAYTVTTYRGTYRVADQCGRYDTELAARMVARAWATLAKHEAAAQPTLDNYTNGRTNVPTIGGRTAAAAHTSDPMDTILMAAALGDGTMRRSRDCTAAQIKALRKRGLVEELLRPASRVPTVVGCRLTDRGWRRARELSAPEVPDAATLALRAALSA